MMQFLKRNFFPLLIVLITILLSWRNYTPGTWLSGWDTLHPEFNFSLNFKRVINGVWREEQGLGAVAAHSHMADLPRILFLWILSFILPSAFLRYFYIFLCLILGPLGVYFFVRKILVNDLASFLGALFYLLNLGTLQHFYVPFEMFPTQFAALGWLFLFGTNFLERKSRSDLALFSLVTFFSTPMAYASQLWYAYFFCFSLYLFSFSFFNKEFKPTIILLLATLIINSYWLLPNLYFLATQAQNVPLAKANRLFSEEAFLANKEFGTLRDTAILKNFLFNWSEYVGNGGFGYLLDEWREHLRNPWVVSIGYGAFGLVLVGLLLVIFKKEKYGLALLPVFLTSLIFLINMNPPFEKVFDFLRENFLLFKEGLRFPFTKFSLLLLFTYAVYFGYAVKFLLKRWVFGLMLATVLIFYMGPAFSGHLISSSMRIKIPKDYFEMFAWFNRQEIEGRVASFPIHNLYGWVYYDWGFQGAGFTWFGIKQPLLDRDFDRWSSYNEEYYREMSYAVYSQNLPLLEKLCDKYQIRWILLDKSVIAPGRHAQPKALFFEEIEAILAASEKIGLAKTFGERLKVYQVNLTYLKQGAYYSPSTTNFFYPFRVLQDETERLPENILEIKEDSFIFKIYNLSQNGRLVFPNYLETEENIAADVFLKRENRDIVLRLLYNLPWVLGQENKNRETRLYLPVNQKSFILGFNDYQNFPIKNLPKEREIYLGKVNLKTKGRNLIIIYQATPYRTIPANLGNLNLIPELCSQPEDGGVFGISPHKERSGFNLLSRNVAACVKIPLSSLIQDWLVNQEVLLAIDFSSFPEEEKEVRACFFDQNLNRCLGDGSNLIKIQKKELESIDLKFILQSQNSEGKEIVYRNFSFSLFKPEHRTELDLKDLKEVFSPPEIKLNGQKLHLQGNFDWQAKGDFEITEFKRRPKPCGDLLPQFFDRRVIEENGQIFVEYASRDGSVCDFFEKPDLPHNQGYLLMIESRNIAGLPLRVCLANYFSQRCDLYTELAKNKTFKEEIFVVPPMDKNGFGYNLHLHNYSVGDVPSINQIARIKILPIPYQWLKAIKIVNEGNLEKQNLLIFNQSFENGWKVLGLKQAEHVLVNNWANGWIIENEKLKIKNEKLRIIYLPQYLEYFGFFLLSFFCYNFLNGRKADFRTKSS